MLRELSIEGDIFPIGQFLVNPYERERTPIILVPVDILRDLPIAHDWDGIESAAWKNEKLRKDVNEHIGSIWSNKTKRDKRLLKSQALKSKDAFKTLLKAITSVSAEPYDITTDPEGVIIWATKGEEFAHNYPLNLGRRLIRNIGDVFNVVKSIVRQFKHLIENNGLNKELYHSNKTPRHESSAQRLFFAVAFSYCKANNIDVSPEIDTGNGKVDFKFSSGFNNRVLVEIKLSTNSNVVHGYKAQLEVYKAAEETMKAIYIVIDVGKMGIKARNLMKMRNDAAKLHEPLSELEFVDGTIKPTASKR